MKLTGKQRLRLKRQLLQEKSMLERRLKQNENYGLQQPLGEYLELSSYDNHPADIGTEMFERSKDLALNANAEAHLRQIGNALERIENGQYGLCATCGEDIPYLRLEAIPTAAHCVKHAPWSDLSRQRPAEEKLLQPPFGRSSLDDSGQNSFDGEDAWQEVNRWGTSNSPAMAEDPEALDYDNLYIESDENIGYVEALESFLATDLYGESVMVVRNHEYRQYLKSREGDHTLEAENGSEDEDDAAP